MKSFLLIILLLIPTISFSGNCIETANVVTLNADGTNHFIKLDPQCPLNYLSVEIYDRWGNKKFSEIIDKSTQVPAINTAVLKLLEDENFKEGTYFSIVKYTWLGKTDTSTVTSAVTFLK